jgi:rare lipoprotein A
MNNRLSSGLAALLLVSSTTLGVTASPNTGLAQSKNQPSSVSASSLPQTVKLGEQPKPDRTGDATSESTIAKIHTHRLNGKPAATLYVRNIPVLTFTGVTQTAAGASNRSPGDGIKIGSMPSTPIETPNSQTDPTFARSYTTQLVSDKATDISARERLDTHSGTLPQSVREPQVSEATLSEIPVPEAIAFQAKVSPTPTLSPSPESSSDPMTRASAIAAQLNQLYRDGLDPEKITVGWQAAAKGSQQGHYVVKLETATLIAVNTQTFSPDTTQNLEQDALQVANRLRRLLGNAAPIREVQGKPREVVSAIAAPGAILSTIQGMASWYGPGFHGNLTASGEVYNQEALTAAHPSLPMGTRVLVTNLDTGRAITVRINDRGPFYGGRVIDLSAGAARAIGVINSGVAPVRVDILGR